MPKAWDGAQWEIPLIFSVETPSPLSPSLEAGQNVDVFLFLSFWRPETLMPFNIPLSCQGYPLHFTQRRLLSNPRRQNKNPETYDTTIVNRPLPPRKRSAAFTYPTNVGRKNAVGRETVWVTLRERAPPTPPAALLSATKLKPRKRNFDTVGRTGLFAKALKSGDWAEAGMMLSASATLAFGKVKAAGAAEGERYWHTPNVRRPSSSPCPNDSIPLHNPQTSFVQSSTFKND